MNKVFKIIAGILVLILSLLSVVGCSKKPIENASSGIAQTTESKTESADVDDENLPELSSTADSGVKRYKNPKNLGLVAYHLSIYWCDSYGTDYESKLKEFTEVVEAGYFNQYFLHATNADNDGLNDMGNVLTEAKIIAKNGGSFWLYVDYDSKKETLKQYEEKLGAILDALDAIGCRDLVNGVHWDEPYYNNYSLKDLQDQMKINYTVFGLRNFPVFAIPAFSEVEPRTNKNGEPYPQITPEYSKYITDAGYDYYSVDVRDGASNGGAYSFYTEVLGVPITSGRDVYYAYEDKLKLSIGHDFNLWHFPCAYAMPTWAGGVAEETFCTAHLEFMAKDILNEKYSGGIALYTYHTHTHSHGRTALQERIPIKDKDGNYTHFPRQVKWENYFKLVKEYNKQFSSFKPDFVKLDV